MTGLSMSFFIFGHKFKFANSRAKNTFNKKLCFNRFAEY